MEKNKKSPKETGLPDLDSSLKGSNIADLPDLDVPSREEELSAMDYAKGITRSALQGGTLSFSDEAIAAARAALGQGTYEEMAKEEREALEKFQKAAPWTSFGAELAGGLATGGALGKAAKALGTTAPKVAQFLRGMAFEGAAEAPVYKTAIHGAGMGALTGVGKTEDKTSLSDLGENVLTGAAVGGAVGTGTKAVTKTLQKILPTSFGEMVPSAKTAYEFTKEKGYGLTSPKAKTYIYEQANKMADAFDSARTLANERVASFLKRADKSGLKIDLDLPTVQTLASRMNLASSENADVLGSLLYRTTRGDFSFKPSEITTIRNILSEIANEPSSKTIPRAISDITSAKKRLNDTLKTQLPGYQDLLDSSKGLYQTIAKLVLKGGEEEKFSTVGKNATKEEMRNVFNRIFEKGGLDNVAQQQYEYALKQMGGKLSELEMLDKILIKKGIIPESVSFFRSAFKGSSDQVMGRILKDADIGAAQVFAGTIRGTEERSPLRTLKKVITTPFSWASEEAIKLAEELPTSPTLRGFGKGVEGVLKTIPTSNAFIHNMPDFALGAIAARLGNYKSTEPYADKLKEALQNNDKQAKNTTLFALRTNPSTREILNNEVSKFRNEVIDANKTVDFSTREEAEGEVPSYESLRNRFIVENETGKKGLEKTEFYSYKDTGNNTTIGHGFNLDAPGNIQKMKDVLGLDDKQIAEIYTKKKGISQEQSQALLNQSLKEAEEILDKKLADKNIKLNENQRAALVSMVYNNPVLLGDKIMSALEAGDYKKAADLIAITSDHQMDKHPGLPTRRRKEAVLFMTPVK